ncbi:MAG: glycosyltransferase family 39 protein [Bacteroidales bacterium]|nr:glycosyltransferase family 39 protein [Bacteroidales bacterium]
MALFTAALRFYVSDNLEYHRDELLYLSLGLHPAAGYATVAPMTGWIAWIMQGIFGTSVFAVRLFPALMSAVMVYLVAAIARETGGTGYARILAAAGFIFSIAGSRTFLSLSPLHTDVFFWTLIFYLIVKYINTSSGRYLLFIGISAGAALLNNYFSGLLILSVLLVLPFTCHRNIFSQRQFRIGMLAGFLIFLPNLVWQIVNGFPALNHPGELEQNPAGQYRQGCFSCRTADYHGNGFNTYPRGADPSLYKQVRVAVQVSWNSKPGGDIVADDFQGEDF